jgi:hypothetical protein
VRWWWGDQVWVWVWVINLGEVWVWVWVINLGEVVEVVVGAGG